jgi:hypothetical protein
LLIIAALITSCAGAKYSGDSNPPSIHDLPVLFPASSGALESSLIITAKVRIDLPKYRIRGICNITKQASGEVRIDFDHSSLFGSYKEEASIMIKQGKIEIYDFKRERLWDNESTLELLSERFDFEILPEDLLYLLLLDVPRVEDLRDVTVGGSGSEWIMDGFWRDRRIELCGEEGKGPVYFRQCSLGGKGCYIIRYGYGDGAAPNRYPNRIVCSKEHTSEKLSMTVVSVEELSGISGREKNPYTAIREGTK